MLDALERSVASYINRQYISLDETVSVTNAVSQMHSKKVETIIVTPKDGKPTGIVTERDVLDKVVMKGIDPDEIFLKDIMTSPILTLSTKATVKDALEIMRVKAIKRIPITTSENQHTIVGIVTQVALANAIRTSVLERTFRPYRVLVREHYKPIAGNLGFLMQFAGILMIAPALLATLLGENKSATGIYLAVVPMSISGFLLNTYGEKSPLNLKQSSIVVVLGFVLLSVFGSLPYMYVNPFWGGIDFATLFINSFFESASGFTTTGISTIIHPEDLPNSFTFYRSYTLWVGGLSFVYLVMSLYYPEKKLVAMKDILGAGILRFKQLASTISIIFIFYAIILTLLVYFLGDSNNSVAIGQSGGIIDSISVVFAALTSGGFVPVSTFLTLENMDQLMVVMAGMIIAALPFAFHYGIFSREIKARKIGSEIIVYGIFLILAIIVFTLMEYPFLYSVVSSNNTTVSDDVSQREKGPATVWVLSAFHVISASTTTGFQFIDLSHLSAEGKGVLIIVMLIGGTAFSTAGGIKIARLIIIFKSLRKRKPLPSTDTSTPISSPPSQFRKEKDLANENVDNKNNNRETKNSKKTSSKTFSSRAHLESPQIPVPNKPLREALLVIALFIAVSFTSALIIGVLDNRSFIDALFESASTISNTGLSVGIATMDLDDISKLVLSMNMILGRFEIIAILHIFVNALRR